MSLIQQMVMQFHFKYANVIRKICLLICANLTIIHSLHLNRNRIFIYFYLEVSFECTWLYGLNLLKIFMKL